MTNRCRNCGGCEHLTQDCVHYGPMYPAPDTTPADYAALDEEIKRKIAQDIFNEHSVHESAVQ